MTSARASEKGFSLVELLIVVTILGLVMGAVYSMYIVHQRSAVTQDEVVEVQQNLRIAMDSIARDIGRAGILTNSTIGAVGDNTNVVNGVPTDTVTFNASSSSGILARMTVDVTPGAVPSFAFTVDSARSVDPFVADPANGDSVRIIRSLDQSEPIPNATYRVIAKNDGRTAGTPSLTLQRTDAPSFTATANFKMGDMIVRSAGPLVETIAYAVVAGTGPAPAGNNCPQGQACVARTVNGVQDIIAQNITDLQFRYILNGLGEQDSPAATDWGNVRAVRVTIAGQTADTILLSGGQPKTRQITSIMNLRNKKDEDF